MIKCKLLFVVLMLLVAIPILSQNMQTVTGKVTLQDTGEVLPGATIISKGTQKGTITDADGNYSISVPHGSILVYSYIGMNAVEYKATQSIINVAFHGGINFGVVGHNDEGLHLSLLSHPAQKVYATAVRQTQVGNHDIIICCLLQMFLRG